MRVVKYAKYNRTKAPEFQVKTEIVWDGQNQYVEKSALHPAAKNHIASFVAKQEALGKVYKNVVPIHAEMNGESVAFEFIKGKSVAHIIGEQLENFDKLVETIEYYIKNIFEYNAKAVSDWESTKEFENIFGVQEGLKNKKAVSPANIDCIFDNFLLDEKNVIRCIDYEWTFSFLVPQEFIVFRTLLYFYSTNQMYLAKKVSEEEFYQKFCLNSDDCKIYKDMEENFQQYAHGKNRRYIYTMNYAKKNTNLSGVVANPQTAEEYVQKDAQIHELHERLHTTVEEVTETHERLHNTIEELQATHERLHTTTDELVKTHGELKNLREEVAQKDAHIANYQATIAKYHKMAKNPFFAAAQVGKAVGRVGERTVKKLIPGQMQRALSVLKNEGSDVFWYKVRNRQKKKNEYELWMEQNENNQLYAEKLEYNPLISVVVPVYNVADNMLRECIDSVLNQTYQNFELCLVDDCSTMESVRKVLHEYEGKEKIKIKYRSENGHISRTTNDGIAMATGEFIGLMDCDDLLAPNALYEMAKKLNENRAYDFIYSDEDKINEEGTQRRDPFFKPDWSPDTFMSYMYTCHFSVFRKSLIDELGGLRVGYEGSQDYDLVLRVMERSRNIGHVAKILYHWRMRKESTANDLTAKPYIIESTIKAKEDALVRRGLKGKLDCIKEITQYRVTYIPQNDPLVSIIIPSKDNYEILKQCITSIRRETTYKNYEIVVVDNGSNAENKKKYQELADANQVTYFHEVKEFNFSYMCNKGASLAKGDYFLFLNDDIEIPSGQGEWLTIMTGQAQVSYTGAVGVKLVYPGTNLIQHVGVLNLPIGPGHAFHRFDDSLNFYWGRNILDYNFTIVTGACMMMAREKFEEIERFDETFPVAYNDVDICFKLVEHGYYNVLRNDIKLVHHESISRGYDENPEKAARLLREREHLYNKHPNFKGYDPCYNPNLTPDKGDFSLKLNRSGVLVSEVSVGNSKDYQEAQEKILGNVDSVTVSEGKICVSGWAFPLTGAKNASKVKLAFVREDGTIALATTTKTYRPDVAAAHRDKGRVGLTGFECVVEKSSIPSAGTYQIGIVIGKLLLLTDKKVNRE